MNIGLGPLTFVIIVVVVVVWLVWLNHGLTEKSLKEEKTCFERYGIDKLDHNYEQKLAICVNAGKVLIKHMGQWKVFNKSDIRGTNASWTNFNHGLSLSAKDCKLEVKVNDLDKPNYFVEFGKDKEVLDEWHARLSVFCNLS